MSKHEIRLPKLLYKCILEFCLEICQGQETVSFYRYFIGVMSLVSKEWYSVVNNIVFKRIRLKEHVGDFNYLLSLQKRGIRIDRVTCYINLFTSPQEINDYKLLDMINMWIYNHNLQSIAKVSPNGDYRYILVNESPLSIMEYNNFDLNLMSVITHDSCIKTSNTFTDKSIKEINQNRTLKTLEIRFTQYLRSPNIHFQLTTLTRLTISGNRNIYFEEYCHLVRDNRMLEKLHINIQNFYRDADEGCEYLERFRIDSVFTEDFVKHPNLKSASFQITDRYYQGEKLLGLVKLLNENNCIQSLSFYIDTMEQLEMELDISRVLSDPKYYIRNSTIRKLNILESPMGIEEGLPPLHFIYQLWQCKSALTSLINRFYENISISRNTAPSIISHHCNLTNLQFEFNQQIPIISDIICKLKHLKSITIDYNSNDQIDHQPFLKTISKCHQLDHIAIYSRNNIGRMLFREIVEMQHPTLKSLGVYILNYDDVISQKVLKSICQNHTLTDLSITHHYIPPKPFTELFTILRQKPNLQSFSYQVSAIPKEQKEVYTKEFLDYYSCKSSTTIYPEKLVFADIDLWDLFKRSLII
ncbi:hypothetical protein DLAC_02988 [Tieghemostelium lacteum]|uniref:Uncharacterized protein n=1 Tax=Tieghemostelium lacteum TaxID=361077 RepID=A0A152A3Y1_TIELA|nr:hypothetical protein DLAC_02988 [Tieghemostelium lacteum]|eukprot:KYR00924.1 hypothetical protein DLAC_02988 [Tieghemostelium lacteum]